MNTLLKSALILCCIVGINTITYAQIPSSGLVAHWPFTGNANDISTNALNGNMHNVALVSGKLGSANTAYKFDSTNSFISIPYNTAMNVTNITICAVIKPSSFYTGNCQGNYVVSRGYQGSAGAYFSGYFDNAYNDCLVADTTSYVFCGQAGTVILPPSNMQCSTKVHTNNWYCFVMTFNGTTGKYYINGSLIRSFTGWTAMGNSTDSLCIGKYLWAGGYPYNFIGVMDDVAMYNRALSDSEINNYCLNAPKEGVDIPDTPNSVNNTSLNNNVSLYPNPNTGNFTVNCSLPNTGNWQMEVFNSLGQIVYKKQSAAVIKEINEQIDIQNLSSGVYMLKLKAGDEYKWIKFSISK